jgi:hypothetical protein
MFDMSFSYKKSKRQCQQTEADSDHESGVDAV